MSCPVGCRCPNCDATMAAVASMTTEEYAEWLRETQAIALRGATARLTATGGTPGGAGQEAHGRAPRRPAAPRVTNEQIREALERQRREDEQSTIDGILVVRRHFGGLGVGACVALARAAERDRAGGGPYGVIGRKTPDYQPDGAEPPRSYDLVLAKRRAAQKGGAR